MSTKMSRSSSHRAPFAAVFPIALTVAAGLAATPAKAGPVNLIQNGSFEDTSAYYNTGSAVVGTELTNSNLADWQLTGCSLYCGGQFLAASNYATQGIYSQADSLLGTFYGAPGPSPAGGNAIASDAGYATQGIYQTVNNLKAGDTYSLSFYQASTQQTGYSGAEADSWQVSFGTFSNYSTQYSATMNNPSQGSTGWVQDTLSFVANAASQVVYFYATTSPGAQPPFLLLDGVALTDSGSGTPIPEPATLALLGAGLAGVLLGHRKRQARVA